MADALIRILQVRKEYDAVACDAIRAYYSPDRVAEEYLELNQK